MIKLKNISKTYHQNGSQSYALRDISLNVRSGEIVGIIGKSGAGKSTLLRCVNLLEKPSRGEVWIDDQNLCSLDSKALRAARLKIGMIFQHFNLLNSKNIFENIALPLKLQKKPKQEIEKRVNDLLDLIDLRNKAKHYPSQLSGGQKQRVAIARALANQPRVLLCDEITSALDPETTQSILRLIRKIQRKLNIAILFITHDMHVIKNVADRVAVIDKGSIVEQSSLIELFKNPKTSVSQSLVHSFLHADLPCELNSQLQGQPSSSSSVFLQIKFLGHPAVEPIIHDLVQRHSLKINIFQAHLDYIQKESIGMMVLSANGTASQIENAITWLNNKHCHTEILGYAHATH